MAFSTLRVPAAALGLALALAIGLSFVSVSDLVSSPKPASSAPAAPTSLYADPTSVHAPDWAPYAGLRTVPQARWFNGEIGTDQIRGAVTEYLAAAARAKARPVLVIYAIPGRDCGSYSAGGMATPEAYRAFVAEITLGLRTATAARPLVIVEPDAIAGAGQCGGTARLSLIRWSAKRLASSGAWIYLDAGHSKWTPAKTMATRLRLAGVNSTRGISLNVSNFKPTAQESRFGRAILKQLKAKGVTGKRIVIDTSRNGVTPKSNEWCNPAWARLGTRPKILVNRAPIDAFLWVKHPGESDGYCNGGPGSGQWSDVLASRLLGR